MATKTVAKKAAAKPASNGASIEAKVDAFMKSVKAKISMAPCWITGQPFLPMCLVLSCCLLGGTSIT